MNLKDIFFKREINKLYLTYFIIIYTKGELKKKGIPAEVDIETFDFLITGIVSSLLSDSLVELSASLLVSCSGILSILMSLSSLSTSLDIKLPAN